MQAPFRTFLSIARSCLLSFNFTWRFLDHVLRGHDPVVFHNAQSVLSQKTRIPEVQEA